jgi:hypothetical protein
MTASGFNEALYLDAPPTTFGKAMIEFGVKAAAEK